MKRETSRHKKLAKKRKLRADFERRQNINRHKPSEIKEFRKDITRQVKDENGDPVKDEHGDFITKKVGTKVTLKRVKKSRKTSEIIAYPSSKKNKIIKADIEQRERARKNIIKTAT